MQSAAVLFLTFFILLILMVPIGYSIGIATLFTILVCGDGSIPLLMITQKSITGVDSFPLMAVPFFMLAGNLMSGGGIAKRILNFFDTFMGFIAGGLSMVTTVTCMFFAAISGSAIATTSAVGAFMIPAMKDKGYDEGFSASICAAAGTIGVIIPPSVPFVIYGVATGTSITDLFKAGIVPGLAMGVALMIVCYIMAKKYGFKGETKKFSFKAVVKSFVDAIWALLSPVIILGGIYSGKFTPTEAAVVAVVYGFIVGVFIYRNIDGKLLVKILRDGAVSTAQIMILICAATLFGYVLTANRIPDMVATAILSLSSNKYVILLLINILLLIVGAFMDTTAALIILVPILYPIVTSVGVNPIHFAMIICDVDSFKTVNDTYGHAVGDEILKKVASLLQKAFRSIDYVCRIGGDEFAVIMVDMTTDLTHTIKEKIDMVNDLLSNPADGLPPVSLSVGVAFSDRQDPGESIFKDADHALYHVKQHGKHGCGFYGAEQEPCAEPDAAVPMSETE